MKWSGLPLTVIITVVSLAISYALFQLGIYFFFLPIIFIPFLRFFKNARTSHVCPVCDLNSSGSYCTQCGRKLS